MPSKLKLLIDENIRREVADFLAISGNDIVRVPKGSSDTLIAKIAKNERRIIITHDGDFTNMLSYPPKEYAGIIHIKIHPPKAETIIPALTKLFTKLSVKKFEKKLIILEENTFLIR